MVIANTIKVLLTQEAFLLKTKGLMHLDGALVISQSLAIDFMQFEFVKSMAECCVAKLPPTAFGGIRRCIKPPLSNAVDFCLAEVHKPHGFMFGLENKQVFFGIPQAAFKPLLMFS